MTALIALVAVTIAGVLARVDLAPWAGLVIGSGFGSVAAGWVVLRRAKTDREDTRADTAQTLTNATEKWSEYVDSKMDEVLDENRRLRESNLAQRAEIAAANAATAAAEAATARSEAERSSERHDMQNELTLREAKIAKLQMEIRDLQREIADLRAGGGTLRRATDH